MKKTFQLLFALVAVVVIISGCSKNEYKPSSTQVSNSLSVIDSGVIITPFGPRKKTDVHLIESGYHLNYANGHLQKLENGTNKLVMDFGVQTPLVNKSATTLNVISNSKAKTLSTVSPGVNDGWIADGFWPNTSATPISYFSTSWIVPAVPNVNSGQLLYIFNGLQDGLTSTSHILQPVLQYGSNGSFGGNYWVIDNWYASCATCPAYQGTAVTVTPSTSLQGVMTQVAGTGGTYDYYSSFVGYPVSNAFQVTNTPEQLVYAYETLETYGTTQLQNYPSDLGVQMSNIEIKTGTSDVSSINWTAENRISNYGQFANIVSQNSPGGEVDLYFYSPPTPISVAEIDISKGDTSYYWSKTGTVSSGTSTNSTLYRSPTSFTVPAGETPSSIIAIAIANTNWCYYWYNDGRMSVGTTTNASAHYGLQSYTLPTGETVSNILSISIEKVSNHVYTWYKDGMASVGNSTSLGAITSPYPFTVAAGESISNIVGIGIAGSDSHCYAWYSDRKVSAGISNQLDFYQPAVLSGF